MRTRLRGELSPRPVRMSVLQLETGELGHQVKFSRPDVSVRATEKPRLLAATETEMMRDDALAQDIAVRRLLALWSLLCGADVQHQGAAGSGRTSIGPSRPEMVTWW